MVANHISVRVPSEDNAFLINAYGMLYEEVTASSLIKIDHEGNILAQPEFGDLGYGVNRAGFVIHSAVHEAKPDIACVIHTHTWAGMALSALDCGRHGDRLVGDGALAADADGDALRQDQLP